MDIRVEDSLFRALIETVTDQAIFMVDSQGRLNHWNFGAEGLYGYKPEQVLKQHISMLYCPEDISHERPQTALKLALAEGKFQSACLQVRSGGSTFDASILIKTAIDDAGGLSGYIITVKDLTKNKVA